MNCPKCGNPTEHDRELPPNAYLCETCQMVWGSDEGIQEYVRRSRPPSKEDLAQIGAEKIKEAVDEEAIEGLKEAVRNAGMDPECVDDRVIAAIEANTMKTEDPYAAFPPELTASMKQSAEDGAMRMKKTETRRVGKYKLGLTLCPICGRKTLDIQTAECSSCGAVLAVHMDLLRAAQNRLRQYNKWMKADTLDTRLKLIEGELKQMTSSLALVVEANSRIWEKVMEMEGELKENNQVLHLVVDALHDMERDGEGEVKVDKMVDKGPQTNRGIHRQIQEEEEQKIMKTVEEATTLASLRGICLRMVKFMEGHDNLHEDHHLTIELCRAIGHPHRLVEDND